MSKKVFKGPYSGERTKDDRLSASEIVEFVCDGDDYERGSVEAARAQADNCSKTLGRLVEKLFDKGVLSRSEVIEIVDRAYDYKDEEGL